MTIPLTIRTAQIARTLRQEGISPTSPDNQTIPRDVADKIITHLKAAAKTPVHNRILAQQTLQVFETLNTRPPGVLASLSLLTLHGITLAAAIVFATVFVVARQGSLPGFLQAAANRPHHKLVAGEIRTTASPAVVAGAPSPTPSTTSPPPPSSPTAPSSGGDATPAAPDPVKHPTDITVVATFHRSSQAAEAYERTAPALQPGQSATLIGNTLLLHAPSGDEAARKQWMNTLGTGSEDLFVQGEAMDASFRVQGIAPTEEAAKDIETQLHDYFRLPLYTQLLIPPWTPSCTLTTEQQLARQTYGKLQGVMVYKDPRFKDLRDKIEAARRAGDTAQVKTLGEESRKLGEELMLKAYQAIADDPAMDQLLARRYVELYKNKPEDVYTIGPKEFAPRMGTADPNGPDPQCARTAARGGWINRTGLILQIEFVHFEDPGAGAPALVQWLSSKNVSQMHYDVRGTPRGVDEDE
jgi:hypothetical protein